MKLSPEELERYARHISLEKIGKRGQLLLKNAKVLVIGSGGLGSPVLQYLIASGVGTVGIVDGDKVELSNLQRQTLFTVQDIGKLKVEVAKKRLCQQNPSVNINTYSDYIDKDNALKRIRPYDIVVDGSDNFSCRYLVNDACVILGKPLVSGAIFKFQGQLSVFNYKEGPTYRCLYPEPPPPDEMPNCSEVGVIGVVPAVVGSFMANEVIKMICQIGELLSGKLLIIDLLNLENGINLFSFSKNNQLSAIKELGSYDFHLCNQDSQISGLELKNLIKEQETVLIDVRRISEYRQFHIKGSKSIPLDELENRMKEIDSNKNVILICQKGIRSVSAVKLLSKYGYKHLKSLLGGIDEWKKV